MLSFWGILVSGLIIFAGSGLALGAALGLTGLLILQFLANGSTYVALDAIWNVLNSFTLSAIPLFIILGEIMLRSGISKKIYEALTPVFQSIPGGLLHTNIAVCTLFGAVSGSSLSTAAAVGSVAYPEMTRRGYDRQMVVSSLAGGGTLGLLIPPSLSSNLWRSYRNIHRKTFLGGGDTGATFCDRIYGVYFRAMCPSARVGSQGPDPCLKNNCSCESAKSLAFHFTDHRHHGEYSLWCRHPNGSRRNWGARDHFSRFFWGDLTPKILARSIFSSTLLFASILFVVLGATVLAQAVSLLGIPQTILKEVSSANLGPLSVLSLIIIIYLILGCFFDGLSLMIMTLPIVVPLMIGLDYDPIWLGVVITILIEIGQITPPVGLNLSVLVSVTKEDVSLGESCVSRYTVLAYPIDWNIDSDELSTAGSLFAHDHALAKIL